MHPHPVAGILHRLQVLRIPHLYRLAGPEIKRTLWGSIRYRTIEINIQKLACFSWPDLLSFPATLSPQFHHVLPRSSPRFAHHKSQNPPQKRHFAMRKNL
jgi:hypothetical protein